MSKPELIVYTGCMFSAKTSSMLIAIEKYRHQKKRIVVFKPVIDDRYSVNRVTSHGGNSIEALTVVTASDILRHLADLDEQPHVIAIDEAFMIPGIADILIYLYRLGITVIVSTLDLSAACKPFPEPQKIFPWATQIYKLSAACTVCGADAHYTHKKQDSDNEIEVGSHELYEPRCAAHHMCVNLQVNSHE
jgi:thymidine kinase